MCGWWGGVAVDEGLVNLLLLFDAQPSSTVISRRVDKEKGFFFLMSHLKWYVSSQTLKNFP